MTVSIDLNPEQERQLEELARQRGKDPSAYVSDLVAAFLEGAQSCGSSSFEKILAPIWEGWRQSGMTEDEIDDLFGGELAEIRRERRPQKGTT